MFKLVRRLFRFIRGKGHAVLDKFEKPEEQLVVFVEELTDSMIKMQKSVAAAVADEKKLMLQLEKQLGLANDWEGKALMALKEGNENLAKQALVRKEDAENHAKILKQNWQTQVDACDQLKGNLRHAKDRLDEAKRQYTLLLARYRSAKTKQKMSETLSPVGDESPMRYIEDLNDKILKIEAETEAHLGLLRDESGDDLEQQFARLENANRGEKALLEFKSRLESQKQIGERDDVEDLKANLGGR